MQAWSLVMLFWFASSCWAWQGLSSSEAHHARKTQPSIPGIPHFGNRQDTYAAQQGVHRASNWTTATLGKDLTEVVTHCTQTLLQDGGLCAQVPMPTPWTRDVDLLNPHPDYPRPQLQRPKWLSLNGLWHFKSCRSRDHNEALSSWTHLPSRRIVVPFPVEAPLSGLAHHDPDNVSMLYHRNFTVPAEWKDQRIILHFDAVDHTSTVYINGKRIGSHSGGYSRFSLDITELLTDGSNNVSVVVYDPTEYAHIPIGKQMLHPPRHPSTLWYTSTSGIWQTVWLEPVPEAHIGRVELLPNIEEDSITITVHGSPSAQDSVVLATVSVSGNAIVSGAGMVGKSFHIKIPQPKLWSPDSPFLYDLNLRTGNDHQGDKVSSYFGMRKVHVGRTKDGALRPMINNEFVFQTGMLDQGFWPDGLYTPPTDAAILWDLQFAKEMGYNMMRKHVKVESDRWYYHADRAGLLVWQDMPAMFLDLGPDYLPAADKQNFKVELQEIMQQHLNFPSIVAWVIFNEGWGQHDTLEVVKFAHSVDPSRMFDGVSGWFDHDVGNFIDMHNYVGPGAPVPTASRASILGEFGGLGKREEGHMWIPEDAYAYEMHLTAKELEERATGLYYGCERLMVDPRYNLSAAVYTQLSDVEAEINGWVTYDRMIKKVNTSVLLEANRKLIDRSKAQPSQ